MYIDYRYQPQLLCPKPGSNRKVLEHVLIEQTAPGEGLAIACDSVALAVVPVILEDGDVPGLVEGRILSLARKALARGGNQYRAVLGAESITLADGSIHPRTMDCQYPDWRRIIPSLTPADLMVSPYIAVNPALLATIGKALGIDALVLTYHSDTTPILIQTRARNGSSPQAPYGVLMPKGMGVPNTSFLAPVRELATA